MKKTKGSSRRGGALVLYQSASVLRTQIPKLTDQYEYQQRVAALRAYAKDPAMAIGEVEVQAAMAMTVKEMRRDGKLAKDGQTTAKTGSPTLGELVGITDKAANNAHSRWAAVAKVSESKRARFWASFKGKPSRTALLNWWKAQQNKPKPSDTPAEVIHGDCLDVLPTLNQTFGTLIADPPYNVMDVQWDKIGTRDEYLEFVESFITAAQRVMDDEWCGFIFCSPRYFADVEMVLRGLDLAPRSRIIWHHANMAKGRDTSERLISTWEPIFHIGSGKLNLPAEWGRDRFDVQTFAVPQTNFDDRKVHQAQKPLALIKWLVGLGSGDVLDLFAGGGTTGVAATELGRRSTLIEKDKKFVETIHARLLEDEL